MFLGAGQPAIPPLGVEPLVLDEDLFLLAMSRALDKTLPSLQSKLQSVIHNVFEQFRLTTPPPALSQPVYYQQRSLEQSSTPISDPKTQIEIVHSHLWKARSKQVALKSTAATGGVKKPRSFRLGASTLHKTAKYQKRNFRSSAASLLLEDAISAQSNLNPASICLVSDTGTSIPNLNFVSTDCVGVDSVLVAKLKGSDVNFGNGEDKSSDRKAKVYSRDVKELSELDSVSVKQDDLQGPNSGENWRECRALHLFDEMQHSIELCNVGRTVASLTSIRDKGGGLVYQPLEYVIGVNYAEDIKDENSDPGEIRTNGSAGKPVVKCKKREDDPGSVILKVEKKENGILDSNLEKSHTDRKIENPVATGEDPNDEQVTNGDEIKLNEYAISNPQVLFGTLLSTNTASSSSITRLEGNITSGLVMLGQLGLTTTGTTALVTGSMAVTLEHDSLAGTEVMLGQLGLTTTGTTALVTVSMVVTLEHDSLAGINLVSQDKVGGVMLTTTEPSHPYQHTGRVLAEGYWCTLLCLPDRVPPLLSQVTVSTLARGLNAWGNDVIYLTLGSTDGDIYVVAVKKREHESGVFRNHISSQGIMNFLTEVSALAFANKDCHCYSFEPTILTPLQLSKLSGTRCIMVGDPKQLPAIALSNVASKFLECSLFECVQVVGHLVILLSKHYKVHPYRGMFPSIHFYEKKLMNGYDMSSTSATFHENGITKFVEVPEKWFMDVMNMNSRTMTGEMKCKVEKELYVNSEIVPEKIWAKLKLIFFAERASEEKIGLFFAEKFVKMEGNAGMMYNDIWGKWKSVTMAAYEYYTKELQVIFLEDRMKPDEKCLVYVMSNLGAPFTRQELRFKLNFQNSCQLLSSYNNVSATSLELLQNENRIDQVDGKVIDAVIQLHLYEVIDLILSNGRVCYMKTTLLEDQERWNKERLDPEEIIGSLNNSFELSPWRHSSGLVVLMINFALRLVLHTFILPGIAQDGVLFISQYSLKWLFDLQLSRNSPLTCRYDYFRIIMYSGTKVAAFLCFCLANCGSLSVQLHNYHKNPGEVTSLIDRERCHGYHIVVHDDGMMIMKIDNADGDKEFSISFLQNMCVYLQLPLLVKQSTLASSVTEVLAYHDNHQMEDKNVVHALLYEEGINIDFFKKSEDMALEILIESLQTHDDCMVFFGGSRG